MSGSSIYANVYRSNRDDKSNRKAMKVEPMSVDSDYEKRLKEIDLEVARKMKEFEKINIKNYV